MKEVDRAFGGDGSNVPSAETMQDSATSLRFPVDIRESSTEYKYLVDLPGVPKSDIKVRECWNLPCCSVGICQVAATFPSLCLVFTANHHAAIIRSDTLMSSIFVIL